MMPSTFPPRLRHRIALAAALGCLACLPLSLQAQDQRSPHALPDSTVANWQTYSYPADGFKADFPSQPAPQKQTVPTDAGNFELHNYMVDDGDSGVLVGICDYGAAVKGRTPDSILEGAQSGALVNVQGHLLSSSKITLGSYPGYAFESENDSMHFSARIYLVGTVLYQTMVASPLGRPYANSKHFLDSFQFIDRTQN